MDISYSTTAYVDCNDIKLFCDIQNELDSWADGNSSVCIGKEDMEYYIDNSDDGTVKDFLKETEKAIGSSNVGDIIISM